ncbi:hypothetical protein ACC713_35200 [Rhizobium johnstonii]|uniref:hypothetical protein n=1 Tax=Rhizobium TaxID=379 RepID=UPI0018D58AD7|nr:MULTISPECIES: hypothetical protein [Rhizobium]
MSQTLTNQINETLAKFNSPAVDPAALVEEQAKNICGRRGGHASRQQRRLRRRRDAAGIVPRGFHTAPNDVCRRDPCPQGPCRTCEMALNESREITSMAAAASETAFSIAQPPGGTTTMNGNKQAAGVYPVPKQWAERAFHQGSPTSETAFF